MIKGVRRTAIAVACAAAVGGAVAGFFALSSHSTASFKTTAAPTFGPQVIPAGGPADPAALVSSLVVTYEPESACASVATTTPIAKVPPACAKAWQPYHVALVPGQDALKRTPPFPQVSAGPGVTTQEAMKLATALWRTKTYQAFALGTRQLGIETGLSPNNIFLVAGSEEYDVEQGDTVTTPLCHFFATEMRVVQLAPDFESFVHRTGRVLGVKARFAGPCYATATDSHGVKHQIFSFNGVDDAVFVGDIGSGDPFGAVLRVMGLGDCSADITKATCAA